MKCFDKILLIRSLNVELSPSLSVHYIQSIDSRVLPCWLWLTHGSCVDPQNKIITLSDAGSRVECPRNIYRLKKQANKQKNMTCGMMTCEMNNSDIE